MPFVPSPESVAATRAWLPGEIVHLFLARTTEYSEKLADPTPEFTAAVKALADRMLGPLRATMCRHEPDREPINKYTTDRPMDHCPDHSDWVLLGTDQRLVEGALAAELTQRLGLADHPIQLSVQCLGYWGTEQDVLGVGVCRIILTRTAEPWRN